jgi:hypothetical protein
MQPSTIIALAMSVTAAFAVPGMEKSGKVADNLCGQNQAESCCNSPSDIAVAGSLCTLLAIGKFLHNVTFQFDS